MKYVSVSFPMYQVGHGNHEAHDFLFKTGQLSLKCADSSLLPDYTELYEKQHFQAQRCKFCISSENVIVFSHSHSINKGTPSSATFSLWSPSHVAADNQRSLCKHYFIKPHGHQCWIYQQLSYYMQKSLEDTQDLDYKKAYETQTQNMNVCLYALSQRAQICNYSSHFIFSSSIICHWRDRQRQKKPRFFFPPSVHFEILSVTTSVFEINSLVTWIQTTAFFPNYHSRKRRKTQPSQLACGKTTMSTAWETSKYHLYMNFGL